HDPAARGETLEVLLVIETGGKGGWAQVVGRRVGVAAAQRRREPRTTEVAAHPFRAGGEAGPVVVGLVEVAEERQPVVAAGDQVVRQADAEGRRQRERLGPEAG